MRSVIFIILLSLLPVSTFAQMPEGGPPPGSTTIDPKSQKRPRMLNQMGLNKKKNPDADNGAAGGTNNAVDTTQNPIKVRPFNPKIAAHRSKQFATFAVAARRGQEMKKHFQRMAKIERIDEIATQAGNTKLKDKALNLKKRELFRHKMALQRLEDMKKNPPAPKVDVKVDGAPAQP
jgi:hypothetical protein